MLFDIVNDFMLKWACEAQIAQLVEQETENLCVAGSIPALGTIYF